MAGGRNKRSAEVIDVDGSCVGVDQSKLWAWLVAGGRSELKKYSFIRTSPESDVLSGRGPPELAVASKFRRKV